MKVDLFVYFVSFAWEFSFVWFAILVFEFLHSICIQWHWLRIDSFLIFYFLIKKSNRCNAFVHLKSMRESSVCPMSRFSPNIYFISALALNECICVQIDRTNHLYINKLTLNRCSKVNKTFEMRGKTYDWS